MWSCGTFKALVFMVYTKTIPFLNKKIPNLASTSNGMFDNRREWGEVLCQLLRDLRPAKHTKVRYKNPHAHSIQQP
jgi:hypothetical protein